MKDLSKSSFIFDLIEEFKIFNPLGNANEFTDEALFLFCDKYKMLSSQRDASLFRYLNSTPNLFRSHLPPSKWTFATAFNVVWYYDELILGDPILEVINYDKGDLEEKKQNLQRLFRLLKNCRSSIDNGYLLFAGENLTPRKTGQFEKESNIIINDPKVLESFQNISMMVKKPSPINNNPADNLTQIEIIYQGLSEEVRKMGMYFPPHVNNIENLSDGVFYDFVTPYERLTRAELIAFDKGDMLETLKEQYRKDISIVLETISNAQRLNSPVLFYRDVDCTAAKSYAAVNSQKNSKIIADTSVYNCVVPYIDGIPPERLSDVRDEIPDAFKDFRAFLSDLVIKTMKNSDNPEEIKQKINSEINSMLRKLNTEINNAKNRWLFHGVAAPFIVLTSSLSLFSSDIDYSKLVSTLMGTGGVLKV